MPASVLPVRCCTCALLLVLCVLCFFPALTPGAEVRVRSQSLASASSTATAAVDASTLSALSASTAANPLVLLRGRVRNLQRQANVLQDLGAFANAAAVLRHADDQLTASPYALPLYCR